MGREVPQHAAGRAAGLAIGFEVVGEIVEEALYLLRSLKAAEGAQLVFSEAVCRHAETIQRITPLVQCVATTDHSLTVVARLHLIEPEGLSRDRRERLRGDICYALR